LSLLDACAIIILVRKLGKDALSILKGKNTIVLAFFEVGNFIWKERSLKKHISLEESLKLVKAFAAVLGAMNVIPPDIEDDMEGIYDIATRTGLTFYDAAYVYVAKKDGFTLVTEDAELAEKAAQLGVRVQSVDEFLKALNAAKP